MVCESEGARNTMSEKEQWYIFTFGSNHKYAGTYVRIYGTRELARKKMFEKYGNQWAFQYTEEQWNTWIEEKPSFMESEVLLEEYTATLQLKTEYEGTEIYVGSVISGYSICGHEKKQIKYLILPTVSRLMAVNESGSVPLDVLLKSPHYEIEKIYMPKHALTLTSAFVIEEPFVEVLWLKEQPKEKEE